MDITQSYLKSVFHYDPSVGVFIWREKPREVFKTDRNFKYWNKRYAGKPAGGNDGCGYVAINLPSGPQKAHRLAFVYMIGRFPKNDVDHINGVRTDNRWDNLREATRAENTRNRRMPCTNVSGHMGVDWCKSTKKWRVRITADGQKHFIGVFRDLDDAVEARKKAAQKYGFHENHGRKPCVV